MARARNIKPSLCENDLLAETGPAGMLLYAVLPMQADREGRLPDRPARIKGLAFPYFAFDVEGALDALTARGFLTRYEVDGVRYIQIVHWHAEQKPHRNEADSIIPECPPAPPRRKARTTKVRRASDQGEKDFALIEDRGLLIEDSLIADRGSSDSLIEDSLIPDIAHFRAASNASTRTEREASSSELEMVNGSLMTADWWPEAEVYAEVCSVLGEATAKHETELFRVDRRSKKSRAFDWTKKYLAFLDDREGAGKIQRLPEQVAS